MTRASFISLLLCLAACRKDAAPATPACPAPSLAAVAGDEPTLDGKLEEPVWRRTSTTGAFREERTGRATSPHSELRATHTKDALVLGLYAADEDFTSADAFLVRLAPPGGAPLTLRVTARGALECVGCTLPAGVTASVDADGTFDDRGDYDEEWLVELRVPWRALGLAAPPRELPLNAWRTDVPKGAAPRTTAWACASTGSLGTLLLAR